MQTPNEIDTPDKLTAFYRRAHRVTLSCATLHLLVCLAFAGFTDTWLMTLTVGVPALVVPWWLSRAFPAEGVSRIAMALGFMVFTGLIVQQTRGDLEAHFSFFVMMSVLVVYCDWRPVLTAFVAIALHHLVFTVLQPMGFGLLVWGDGRGPWSHFVIHGAVGAFQAGALCYLATMMRRLVIGSMQVSSMAQSIASGRLDTVLDDSEGSRSEMLASMHDMQQRLSSVFEQVRKSVHTLGTAVGEIAHGTTDLSARTESSAARTQNLSSELVRFVDGSRAGLESTVAAGRVSDDAGQMAEQAGAVVGRVVSAMESIESNSKRISDITAVIDGIAFQTNILALNAAVEAARAGEHGRGFAVVATEVRNLAKRSAEAAREIGTLITGSSETIASGSVLVQEAGQAMKTVVSSVSEVRSLIQQAAQRVLEERPRLESLGASLQDIDSAMQQNASFVEELSATTQSLREQQSALRHSIQSFARA